MKTVEGVFLRSVRITCGNGLPYICNLVSPYILRLIKGLCATPSIIQSPPSLSLNALNLRGNRCVSNGV